MSYIMINKVNFHKGVKIKKSEIKKWHEEILRELQTGSQRVLRASGNSFVFGYKQSDGSIIIREVTKGYIGYEYDPIN